jgi:hypothetical protein
MKTRSRIGAVTGSIKGLFVHKKPNITRLNHPDQYYRQYYFPKNLSDGIDLTSAFERTSKRDAAIMLMTLGLRIYIGDKCKDSIQHEVEAREKGERRYDRFAILLKRLAKQNGVDISKLI